MFSFLLLTLVSLLCGINKRRQIALEQQTTRREIKCSEIDIFFFSKLHHTTNRRGACNFGNKCGVTTNMSSDITVAHIHGLLENFSKNVYRAKDSDQGSLVSVGIASGRAIERERESEWNVIVLSVFNGIFHWFFLCLKGGK